MWYKIETISIEKEGSGARDVLEVGALEETCIFKEASIFENGRLQELGSLPALERIFSRPSRVKIFQPLQMRRIPLFIDFTGRLYEFELGWSMDHTYRLNHMDLGFI